MNDQPELQEQLNIEKGSNDINTSVIGAFCILLFTLMLMVQLGTATADRLQGDLDYAAEVIAEQDDKIEQTEKQRDEANQKAHDNQQKIDDLEGQVVASKGVSIAIACDQTGSMKHVLARLRAVLLAIAEMFPMATEDFSIGVILYGNGSHQTFQLKRIVHPDQDGGASLTQLQDFAERMTCAGGQADIDLAVAEAMKMLDAAPNSEKSRQLLLVCGDVSHGECQHHGPGDDDKLVQAVTAWATASGTHRRVLGLHTGLETHPARAFYERLGEANGASAFGSDPSDIFKMIFTASFGT
ncbi:VWA domain-containing protein [Rhodopirellula sp. JC740]|uniref:VWA domain-containing protein n=1 Tax=Rhodopirellula halodulae TaxID=2894198 RepID=A0ABS8NNP9_9BACT|nr:vWA domain-containing protein [Rhodopirellula sp. JC740]MCC9645182.1 VWA domain-containing protein [Rhodopirellula sp. JC740]